VILADGEKRDLPSHVTLVTDPVLVSELEPEEVEGFFQIAVVQSRKVLEYVRTNLSKAGELFDDTFLGKIVDHPENNNFSFEIDTLPEPFPAPTLIVSGRQDSAAGYRDAWKILENYPRGTFVVLDRMGHLLGAEQEYLFHSLAGEWLDRVEEYTGVSE
jgi:pimeloyl-ACP methyl ester carboxylesterase